MKKFIQIFCIAIATWVTTSMNACSAPTHSSGVATGTIPNTPEALLAKTKEILNTNCVSCHSEGGSGTNFNLLTSEDFVRAGLIVPGVPNQSKLIFRLRNFQGTYSTDDGAPSANNMPPRGSISESDFKAMYTWILEMPSTTSPYSCNEKAVDYTQIAQTDAKRLSIRQYRNTIVDLFGPAITRSTAQTVLNNATSGLFFPDDVGTYFKRESNVFDGNHADAYFNTADRIALAISGNATHTQSVVTYFINLSPGSCTNTTVSTLSAACRNRLVNNLGSRFMRRPLRIPEQNVRLVSSVVVDENEPLLNEFSTGGPVSDGLNRLLFRLLISPHFLAQIEDQNLVKNQVNDSNVFTLDSFAIISRLSYRFWNTMPDETLWNLALTEDLNDNVSYLKAIDHILSQTAKLDDSFKEYMNDWLKLDSVPQFSLNPRFALLSPVTFNTQLRQDMIREVEEMGSYVARNRGSFSDLFTNDVSFARSSGLMNIYGMSQAAPNDVTTSNAVRFPAGERAGFLTRAAMLISGSEFANPILRGIHIRKDILCLTLDSPPADALDVFNGTDVPHISTTREKVQIKTSGTSCRDCHSVINPLGFALSNYNSFGAFTTQEPIFSQTSNSIETTVPIDSQVNLSGVLGIRGNINGAVEYSRTLADQQSAKACFTEKMMRYTFNRNISSTRDACRLDKIYSSLDKSGQLIDTYRSSAMDPEFRLRRIEP